MRNEANVLVIGAGLIGSSAAMHLSRFGIDGVQVVDFDLEGSLSSSELNAGGVRASFSQPVNILCSKLSIEYFAAVAEEVGYRSCGYLWLHPAERIKAAHAARERQLSLGWKSEVWDVAELKRQRPFIDKAEGIAEAIFVPRDGLVNPNLLKNHFRAKAREAGASFHDRLRVRAAEFLAGGRIRIIADKYPAALPLEERAALLTGGGSSVEPERVEFEAKHVVNCAGPWAPEIAQVLGYSCPSYPVRRQISIFDCRDVDLTPYGMTVDTSGVYFHPEATNGLAGFADHGDRSANFQYDGEDFFMEKIWAPLFERSTGFEKLKHLTGWAGLYEVSPDESAIIGKVTNGKAGEAGSVYEAHSFSGHGAMHSYAAGLAVAELMARGRYETIDVSELSGDRFAQGREVREGAVI